MRYAFMTFSTPDMSLDELIRFTADTGYDGVELRVEAKHRHGVELSTSAAERAAIRQAAIDGGIAWACIATSAKYLQAEQKQQHIDDTLRYIELAKDIGCPSLRVFGAGSGDKHERRSEAQREELAGALSAVAKDAEAAGVTICLETHDLWCNAHDVADVLKAVDSPAIACNWDFSHCHRVCGQSVEMSYATLKPWIKHVHMHAGYADGDKFTFVPFGDERNEWDHDVALKLLIEGGFDGYMSGEWLGQWSDPHTELPRELASIKAMEAKAREALV